MTARDALERYGNHEPECRTRLRPADACSCGYQAALNADDDEGRPVTDLRALLANATPRPWLAMIEDDREAWITTADLDGPAVLTRPEPGEPMGLHDADAALIVVLVNAADELVAVTEAAQRCFPYVETDAFSGSNIEAHAAKDALRDALAALDKQLAEENT